MEGTSSKTNYRINKCTHRRLNIELELDEHLQKQKYLSNIQCYKYRQELFNRKLNHLQKCLENLEPYETDDINEEESIMAPNCSIRIQNHFRLLNFSSDTEKRLLGQPPLPSKPSKQHPNIPQKRASIDLNQSFKRIPKKSASRTTTTTTTNEQTSNDDVVEQKSFQSYINQQINGEHEKQMKNDRRKNSLLKEFDQLKHTIDDPNNTLSVLAALSRALLFLDSATE